jgi:hypothetical protein
VKAQANYQIQAGCQNITSVFVFFWFMWVPDQGPEQRESKETVLYPQGITSV